MSESSTGPGFRRNPRAAIDWTTALTENERWLRNVLLCRVGDLHVVEDLQQEIALAVFRQSAKPTDPNKVAPWLYRLAIRYAINFHRQTGRKRKLADRLKDMCIDNGHDDSRDALEWLVQNEQRSLIHRAMQQMRPQDREILILKYTENWTYRQLARHLGASLNTIEYRLLRAKKRLRKLLSSVRVYEALK